MASERTIRSRRPAATYRDSGAFIALPWSVVDSENFRGLGHPARSLLIEFARQLAPYASNNGQLVASRNYLRKRGWRSADVICRAKRELISAGFVHETLHGHRPNKASWFAVTWCALVRHPKYDPETTATFVRGAYDKNRGLVPRHGRTVSRQLRDPG